MKPAIEIRNLGKEYKIASSQRYVALRDVLAGSIRNIITPKKNNTEKFWALKDINLDIMPGERIGIIGRNGAGKSTLLKIISRITPPTTGEAIINGRVGSLLEVGTGFHPELTGRENIYLNGSILGLKKREIDRQLEAIIDFSGVEKFIDTPLKHFSSGMQLRLAFAVAAHLEPEILLIDEVLAVGDMEFQKKCIGKMEEVSKSHGRTIVFVSHQMNALNKLCDRCVWIDKGRICFDGETETAISQYTSALKNDNVTSVFTRDASGEHLFFNTVEISNPVLGIGDSLQVSIVPAKNLKYENLILNINIEDEWGDLVCHITNEDAGFTVFENYNKPLHVTIRNVNMLPGRYYLSFWAGLDIHHGIDQLKKAIGFEVTGSNNFTQRLSAFPSHSKIILKSEWQAL